MGHGLRVALALGSGGARGYAHLGAVQVLRERGYEISAVAGTSMGALVGGLVAAGRDEEFSDWAQSLKQRDVLRLAGARFTVKGPLTADGALEEVERLVPGMLIEDLPIPFTAVATDLQARREVWFQSGPITSAIRASIAIPGLFVPAIVGGRVLVDGGILNPLPIDPTAATPVDLRVAVSLQGPRSIREPATPSRESSALLRPAIWKDELLRRFRRADGDHDADSDLDLVPDPAPEPDAVERPPGLNAADVVSLSYDAMQGIITRYRIAALPPDVLVTVPVDSANSLDFHRATELIGIGRELTERALDAAGY